MDYYKILEIQKGASKDEIKKSYRKLAHKYHPDKGGDEKKFKEINEAYQTLSDDKKRQQYDQFGKTFDGGGGGFNPGGFGAGGQNGFEFDVDFGDIFEQFFGRGQKGKQESRGRNIEIAVDITLEQAYSGVKKDLAYQTYLVCENCNGKKYEVGSKMITCPTCRGVGKIQSKQRTILGMLNNVQICPECRGAREIPDKKCSKCYGEGRVNGSKKIIVNIPAGISNGDTVRVSGAGEAGASGKTGDLYVRVGVMSHSEFKRRDSDLYNSVHIKFSQAALGDKIKINTIDGKVELKIPQGTQAGNLIRLKGKGMPKLHSRGRGDYYVEVSIDTPKKISKKVELLLKKLKEEGI